MCPRVAHHLAAGFLRAGDYQMREIHDGKRRQIISQLYLDLSTAFSDAWRRRGVSIRQSFDMVAIAGLIFHNHRQGNATTAHEIEQRLGIPRSTVQRRCELMMRLGYLASNGGSAFHISDQGADATWQLAQFAEIEAAIHRASHLLHTLNDEENAA